MSRESMPMAQPKVEVCGIKWREGESVVKITSNLSLFFLVYIYIFHALEMISGENDASL